MAEKGFVAFITNTDTKIVRYLDQGFTPVRTGYPRSRHT